jgi:PAS domain-containing protein
LPSLLRDDVVAAWGHDSDRLAVAEDPRARRATQLVFVLGALLYPGWHWILLMVMPEARDSLAERTAISTVIIAAIVCMRVGLLRRYMMVAQQTLLFVLTAHHLSIVWRNDLAMPYLVSTYVVFCGTSIMITRFRVSVLYAAFCLVTMAVMVAFSENPSPLRIEVLFGAATILIAVCAGSYQSLANRTAAYSRIAQGRLLLKQIIETIPDPVFVRDPDGALVLSNDAGRRFESSTGYDLASVSRQEQRALATGECLEEDTVVPTRFGRLSMSVKTAAATFPGTPSVVVTIMRDVTERRGLEESLRNRLRELEEARERVRQLQGMLPICMHCSRIRVGDDQWEKLESYVSEHSSASFTHTLCSSCLEQHYPQEGMG